MVETQELVKMEESAVLAELAKSFGETGGESSSSSSLARLRIERENLEDSNGDIICPSGHFSVSTDEGKVYAKEVSFRYYEHRYRYKRYDAFAERVTKDGEKVQGSYIHSVLVKGHEMKPHLMMVTSSVVDPLSISKIGSLLAKIGKSSCDLAG